MYSFTEMLCFILQFLALPSGEQINYCSDYLPIRATDWIDIADSDDEARYNKYCREQLGFPFLVLQRQYESYYLIFSHSEENFLDDNETILEELNCLLVLMTAYGWQKERGNIFWGADVLQTSTEWRLVRRLAKEALRQLKMPNIPPSIASINIFEDY